VASKSKKNATFLHPLDKVMQWYAEAQTIPQQLKNNFELENLKAKEVMKSLKIELRKAKALQLKAKNLQTRAVQNTRIKSTQTSQLLARKYKSFYNSAVNQVKKITKDIEMAKTQLNHTKIKQKYFNALQAAFRSVTRLFSKKHGKSLKKQNTAQKRRAIVAKPHAKMVIKKRAQSVRRVAHR
jgi:hypothetical protein